MTQPTVPANDGRVSTHVATPAAQGPFQIDVEFWFQPISFRWANNLKSYKAMETERFTGYYDTMSSGSAVMLTRATATK